MNKNFNGKEDIRKEYNPFKMGGSYIGAITIYIFAGLLILYYLITDIIVIRDFNTPIDGICSNINGFLSSLLCVIPLGIALHFSILLVGFLIGLGIHSIIRRLT